MKELTKEQKLEEQRQLSLIPGKKVKMENCFEEEFHKDVVWTVQYGPQMMCGEWVVWLEGYSGAFSCEFLKEV